MLTGSKLEIKWNQKREISREEVEFLNAWAAKMLEKAIEEDLPEKIERFQKLQKSTSSYLNREKVIVVKSTIPTIKRYGFDIAVLRTWMADFGYKVVEKLNGFYAIVDAEGEIVDWAKPVLVHFNDQKFGNVRFGEMNSQFDVEIDGEPSHIAEDDEWYDIDTTKCL